MKDKQFNSLLVNTIMLYIMQISGYIFPLFTFPYLTRVLNVEYYGMITFITATMVYFQMLIDFGFLLSATRECSENRNDKKRLSEIFSTVVASKGILTIFGFFILLIIVLFVPSFTDKRLLTVLYYLSITTSILMPDYLFRGLEKMNIITYITIIGKVIYTISIFLFIKSENDYILIPVIIFISNLAVSFFTYKEIRKLGVKFVLINKEMIQKSSKQSAKFFISRIASTAYSSSNILFLGLVTTNATLALFGVANTIIVTIKSLFSPIADSIYPYMLNTKNFKLIKIILIALMPVVAIGCITVYVIAEPLIILLAGNEYVNATKMLQFMLPIILFTLPSYLLGFPVLGAMNKMDLANLSVIYPSIFHFVGLIILLIVKKLTVGNVIVLTIITEMFVLVLRAYYIMMNKRLIIPDRN